MAINWDIKITNVNVVSKRGDITATRTDSVSALAPQVYFSQNTLIGTPQDRTLLLNSIKAEVVAATAKEIAVKSVITDLEQAGKTALETWEGTR
jgi:hypothetical protein